VSIVELFGDPGSGKSSVMNTLHDMDQFGFTQAKCLPRFCLSRFARSILGVQPDALREWLSRQIYRLKMGNNRAYTLYLADRGNLQAVIEEQLNLITDNNYRSMVMMWFKMTFSDYLSAQSSQCSERAILFDEGLLYRAIGLFCNPEVQAINWGQLDLYLEEITMPDFVLLVTVDGEEAKKRLRERGGTKRLAGKDEHYIELYYKRYSELKEYVLDYYKGLGGRVLEVDNSGDLDSLKLCLRDLKELGW